MKSPCSFLSNYPLLIMLGLDNYASDSDEEGTATLAASAKVAPKPNVVPKSQASSSGLSVPAPKATKKGATRKILVEMPKPAKRTSDDEDEIEKPAAKKLKMNGERGARSSGLLSMLPAPKRSTVDLPAPQRVLGGGRPGIVYSMSSSSNVAATVEDPVPSPTDPQDDDEVPDTSSRSLLPPSLLLKGKGKAKQPPTSSKNSNTFEETNFFSLGMIRPLRLH